MGLAPAKTNNDPGNGGTKQDVAYNSYGDVKADQYTLGLSGTRVPENNIIFLDKL